MLSLCMEDNSKLFRLRATTDPSDVAKRAALVFSAVFSVYFKIGKSGELKNYIERPSKEN